MAKGAKIWQRMGKSDEEIRRLTAELQDKPVPDGAVYLQQIFIELCQTRTYDFGGQPCPVSYTELQAYSNLTDTQLTPWEISTLRAMDDALIDTATKKVTHEATRAAVQGKHKRAGSRNQVR